MLGHRIFDKNIVKDVIKMFGIKGIPSDSFNTKLYRIGLTLFPNGTWDLSIHSVNAIETYFYDKNQWIFISSDVPY